MRPIDEGDSPASGVAKAQTPRFRNAIAGPTFRSGGGRLISS
jgi:hypothetical protein